LWLLTFPVCEDSPFESVHAFNAANGSQTIDVDACLRPYIDSLSFLQGWKWHCD